MKCSVVERVVCSWIGEVVPHARQGAREVFYSFVCAKGSKCRVDGNDLRLHDGAGLLRAPCVNIYGGGRSVGHVPPPPLGGVVH